MVKCRFTLNPQIVRLCSWTKGPIQTYNNLHITFTALLLGAGGRSNLKQIGVFLELPKQKSTERVDFSRNPMFFLGGERADLYEIQRQSP